jgi:hypothetical protein
MIRLNDVVQIFRSPVLDAEPCVGNDKRLWYSGGLLAFDQLSVLVDSAEQILPSPSSLICWR